MTKLKKSEKILLLILIALLIFVVPFILLIRPQTARNSAARDMADNMEQQQNTAVAHINALPDLREKVITERAEFDKVKDLIPLPMYSYGIHYFIQDMCADNSVILDGISIGQYSPVTGQATDELDAPPAGGLLAASISVKITGSFSKVLNLLDEFDACIYTHVLTIDCGALNEMDTMETVISLTLYGLEQAVPYVPAE